MPRPCFQTKSLPKKSIKVKIKHDQLKLTSNVVSKQKKDTNTVRPSPDVAYDAAPNK